MKQGTSAELFSQREMAHGHFLMTVRTEAPFKASLPGQFVMMRPETGDCPFLPRPFSIYSVRSRGDDIFVDILYTVVGKGTEVFSRLREGDPLHILGPLGRGFDIPPSCERIVLIAGGIGVPPLSFLAQRCREGNHPARIICYVGARNAGMLVGLDRLQEHCSAVEISTDDGSRGYHGPVTELFRRDIDHHTGGDIRIYSCGPRPMLIGLQALLKDRPVVCQASLEERMACGIGACLGCVVRTHSDGTKSNLARVCKEGPVFDISEIEFGK